jgi:hypothetical protein
MDNFLRLLLVLMTFCEGILLLIDGAELLNTGQPLRLAAYVLISVVGSKVLDKILEKGAGLS